MSRRWVKSDLPPPFLKRLSFLEERVQADEFPFNIPAFQRGKLVLDFERPITIIVGENGTGKSSLLEGIADLCGFNLSGGNRNHVYSSDLSQATIGHALRGSWLPKVTRGFFLRAESFFNFGHYVDALPPDSTCPNPRVPYGGKSLHEQSHGESFLNLFTHKFRDEAIYVLDEPEAALSPKRQLQFLKLMRLLELEGSSQFIIATHSPILMAYPRAQLLMFDGRVIREASLSETPHYQLTRNFVMNPKAMMDELFAEVDAELADD
ncbi:MAG: AAA family ATPase [Rhodospirillum sp.]|nr:AAA family ATPase [Rhodospirillum sp.]